MEPRLYSRLAIVLSSFLLTPFVGYIYFCLNLKEVGDKVAMRFVLILGIVWLVIVERNFDNPYPIPQYFPLIIPNAIGACLLAGPFWYMFLKDYRTYTKRNPWYILLSIVVVLLILRLVYYL